MAGPGLLVPGIPAVRLAREGSPTPAGRGEPAESDVMVIWENSGDGEIVGAGEDVVAPAVIPIAAAAGAIALPSCWTKRVRSSGESCEVMGAILTCDDKICAWVASRVSGIEFRWGETANGGWALGDVVCDEFVSGAVPPEEIIF